MISSETCSGGSSPALSSEAAGVLTAGPLLLTVVSASHPPAGAREELLDLGL